MKRATQLLGMIAVSCNNLSAQVAALLLLEARDFGIFSLGYLTFSLAASVGLSVISEAYARVSSAVDEENTLENYAAISTWLALLFASVAALLFAILSDSFLTVVLSFIAVGCAARRMPVRYLELRRRLWLRVLTTESTSFVVFVVGLTAIFAGLGTMDSILLAWSMAGMAMWLLGTMPQPGAFVGAVRWVRQYRYEMGPLLKDSIVLDVSSIGTPYVLAPILGPTSFGVYRAVSNFNAPMRLIVNFIRPYLATRSVEITLSRRYLLLLGFLSVGWGLGFSILLLFIGNHPSGIPMLDALAPYWLPTGLYMMSALGLHYFYIVARIALPNKGLWRGRLVQSSIAIVLPISGSLCWGLSGAVWGIAIATIAGKLTWFCFAQRETRS